MLSQRRERVPRSLGSSVDTVAQLEVGLFSEQDQELRRYPW